MRVLTYGFSKNFSVDPMCSSEARNLPMWRKCWVFITPNLPGIWCELFWVSGDGSLDKGTHMNKESCEKDCHLTAQTGAGVIDAFWLIYNVCSALLINSNKPNQGPAWWPSS